MTKKKMFYLDVDGVINALHKLPEGEIYTYLCKGFTIRVPGYMAPLIQGLYTIGNIRWLTTWRDNANEWISPLVGLPNDLPVITDGTDRRTVDWKNEAALKQAEIDQHDHDIYWIEDFGPGLAFHEVFHIVTPVNTAINDEFVLMPYHLPTIIQNELAGIYEGPMRPEFR